MIEVKGPPSRWVVRGGRPSDVVMETHDGIPSYESDTGKILVYDLLVAAERRGTAVMEGHAVAIRETMLVSRGYSMVAARSVCVGDHELCALYDDPDAAWVWRPLIYRLGQALVRLGSQQELEWRWSLQEMNEARQDVFAELGEFMIGQVLELRRRYGSVPPITRKEGGKRLRKNARKRLHREYEAEVARLYRMPDRLPFMGANERADAILREHLCPQQLLDLDATAAFYVRGTLNRLYRVELGNGAQIVDPETRTTIASLCLHPERWMPHADVALATKLAIESGPEREEEILAGARVRWLSSGRASRPRDRYAWDRERYLYPEPLAT
jgi:hypothetical protein